MSTGEMLDTSLRIYQRLGLSFLRLSIVPALLCLASIAFVLTFILPSLFTTQDSSSFFVQLGEVIVALAMALFVGGPLFLIGLSYTTAIVVTLVSDFMVGNVPNPEAALISARTALRRLFFVNLRELFLSISALLVSVIVMVGGGFVASVTEETDILAGIVSLIGVLGLMAGGFVFLAILSVDALAAPVSVLEQATGLEASRRSRSLMKVHRPHGGGAGPVWALYLMMGFIALSIWGGLSLLFSLLGLRDLIFRGFEGIPFRLLVMEAVDLLPAFLTVWTLVPVWAATVTIIYYDRRVRLEGYDIEILAKEVANAGGTSRFSL